MTIGTILLLAALVCFVLVALSEPRGNWVAIGLACWVAASLFGAVLVR